MKKNADILSRRICANVKKLASDRGWTRVELAQKSGVSYRTILAIIAGTASLRDTTVWKLARVFHLSPADLEREEIQALTCSEPHAPYNPRPKPAAIKPGITTGQAVRHLAEQFCVPESKILEAVVQLMHEPESTEQKGR